MTTVNAYGSHLRFLVPSGASGLVTARPGPPLVPSQHYSFATFTSHFTSEWCRLPSSWTTGLRSRSNHRKKSEKHNFDSLVNAYRRRDIGATWLLTSSNNNIRRGRLRGIIRQKVILLCNTCKDKLEMCNRILPILFLSQSSLKSCQREHVDFATFWLNIRLDDW